LLKSEQQKKLWQELQKRDQTLGNNLLKGNWQLTSKSTAHLPKQ
jgi:hypothetical protein